MITRRDLLIALFSAVLTASAFAIADQGPVLGSTAFDFRTIPVKVTDVGSVRSFVNQRTATVDELEIHMTTLNRGKSPHPPHRHPNEELIILEQGTVETLSNGEWKQVGPGSVIFNASNQLHGLKNIGNEPAIYHVVNWKTPATPAPSQ